MFASSLRPLLWVALLALTAPACRSDAETDAPDTSRAAEAALNAPGGGGEGEASEATPPPAPQEPAVVQFEHKPLPQGAARVEKSETIMTMSMTVSLKDEVIREGNTEQRSQKRKRITLLKTDTAGAPVEAKIVYEEIAETHKEGDGKPEVKPSPLEGETYVVTIEAGEMVVKDARGADVPAAESDEVIADNGDLLKPDMLHTLIPRGPVEIGERIPVNETFLRRLFDADAGGAVTIQEAWLALKEVREVEGRRSGVFETRMKLVAPVSRLEMGFDMTGELVVALADTQLVKMNLKGPVRFATPEGQQGPKGVQLVGEGHIAILQESAPAP